MSWLDNKYFNLFFIKQIKKHNKINCHAFLFTPLS